MWLWNHDSEFTKWQHPAMWYVALGWHAVEFARLQHPAMWYGALRSWHWFARWQYPAMWQGALVWHAIEFAQTSAILEFYIWFRFRPYHRSRSAPVCEILSKSDHPRPKKCRFSRWQNSAILDFRGPIMGSLKSQCTNFYRSSIETIALNCLVFEKIEFFCILSTDRQTDEQMDSIDVLSRSRCRERRLKN